MLIPRLWLFGLLGIVIYSASTVAETVIAGSDIDLISYVFNPKTGTLAILLIAVVMLWRRLQQLEVENRALRDRLVDLSNRGSETVQAQRDHYAKIREEVLRNQIELRDVISKATLIMQKSNDLIEQRHRD